MVARGDLGVEVPMEEIPTLQKDIVAKCVRAARPVIIATQMMENMISNARQLEQKLQMWQQPFLRGVMQLCFLEKHR